MIIGPVFGETRTSNLFSLRSARFTEHPAAFRFLNLEVDSGIIFNANDPEKRADGFRGRALAANYLAHILGVNVKRQEHAHFINLPVNFDIIRMINDGLHKILQKFFVYFLISHSFQYYLKFATFFITGYYFFSSTGAEVSAGFAAGASAGFLSPSAFSG